MAPIPVIAERIAHKRHVSFLVRGARYCEILTQKVRELRFGRVGRNVSQKTYREVYAVFNGNERGRAMLALQIT